MRTKTFLLTAAVLAVGIGASMAQVYSVNAVGYVNKSFPNGGLALIANPLNGTNNQISTVIPGAPDDTLLYRFSGTAYYDAETVIGGLWYDSNLNPSTTVLNPGEGFFLVFPDNSPRTLTFVGEVPQGNLTNTIPAGYSIRSSIVPQSLGLSAMGMPAGDDDLLYFWNYASQGWNDAITYISGSWYDSNLNPIDPVPAVGEAFFVSSGAQRSWVRTFSVNN
jgi:hypothetical protein